MREQLYIGGSWVDASGGGRWDLVNPATEELIEAVPYGDAADARLAIDAAAGAFGGLRMVGGSYRPDQGGRGPTAVECDL